MGKEAILALVWLEVLGIYLLVWQEIWVLFRKSKQCINSVLIIDRNKIIKGF